jgi:hypothetical protein
MLPSEGNGAGLVARDALSVGVGRVSSRVSAGAATGAVEMAVAHTAADVGAGAMAGLPTGIRVEQTALALAFRTPRARIGLAAGVEREDGAFLGARLAPVFGLAGGSGRTLGAFAETRFRTVDLRLALESAWYQADAGAGLLAASEDVRTVAWSVHAAAPLGPGHLLLDLAGPEAVTGGGFRLAGSGAFAPLAPGARETAVEAGYALGPLAVGAFVRYNAGHRDGLTDLGAALRFSTRF